MSEGGVSPGISYPPRQLILSVAGPHRIGGPPSFACVQGTITLSHTFPAVFRDNMEPLINR